MPKEHTLPGVALGKPVRRRIEIAQFLEQNLQNVSPNLQTVILHSLKTEAEFGALINGWKLLAKTLDNAIERHKNTQMAIKKLVDEELQERQALAKISKKHEKAQKRGKTKTKKRSADNKP